MCFTLQPPEGLQRAEQQLIPTVEHSHFLGSSAASLCFLMGRKWIDLIVYCVFPAETLPHEENGLMKEQRYMDSASNSMTPRPQTVRGSSEYHSQTSAHYHHGNSTPMRRLSSNSTDHSSSQKLRRVEGTVTTSSVAALL